MYRPSCLNPDISPRWYPWFVDGCGVNRTLGRFPKAVGWRPMCRRCRAPSIHKLGSSGFQKRVTYSSTCKQLLPKRRYGPRKTPTPNGESTTFWQFLLLN